VHRVLPGRDDGNEELGIEPLDLDLRREPMREQHQRVKIEHQPFALDQLMHRYAASCKRAAVLAETRRLVGTAKRDRLTILAACQQNARLFEEFANGSDAVRLRRIQRTIRLVNATAGKNVRAPHERNLVVPSHQEHVESSRGGPQKNDGGRGTGGSDGHCSIYTPESVMRSSRFIVLLCLAILAARCKKPETPTTTRHAVGLWMDGERRGEEVATMAIEQHRTLMQTKTEFNGPQAVRLEGQLLLERGRATLLRVSGDAPDSLPALVNVSTTPDRTDTFPIRGPLPVHVLSALVRQSMVASRRTFVTLPEGRVTVAPCHGSEGPFTDATCHSVAGLVSGAAFVWIDRRGRLVAALARTPWGVLIATPPQRDKSHSALLERFDVYSGPSE
jgi:hypothetical protein